LRNENCQGALKLSPFNVSDQSAVVTPPDAAQGVLRIVVSDNGPGIDAATAERMFRPFFTTKAKGTGLGLALVLKIIVTHNGRIAAASRDGGGARLTVSLPLSAAPEPLTEV